MKIKNNKYNQDIIIFKNNIIEHSLKNEINHLESLNILLKTDFSFMSNLSTEEISFLMDITKDEVKRIEKTAMKKFKDPEIAVKLKVFLT